MSEQRLAIRAESIQLAIDTLADGDIGGTVSQLEGLLDCAPFIDEVEPDHSHHANARPRQAMKYLKQILAIGVIIISVISIIDTLFGIGHFRWPW